MSSLQKITAAYRILAYGTPTDSVDEYIRIGESTTIESLRRFVKVVIAMFGDHYLRSLNNIDIARLLQTGEQRGFPGMLCHDPIPGPTRLADPNRFQGARPYTGTLYLFFFFKAELAPVGMAYIL